MKVAIQGELGSFSHEAAGKMLPRASVVPCARSAEVFDRVEKGSVDAAVIPIENSLAGSVAEHFDLLLARELFIHAEFHLRIRHNLIAPPGVALKQIRRVFSHPVALDQCRNFFRAHPQVQAVPFYDTAGSVRHIIAEKIADAAGIAAKQAAAQYGGRVLLAGIEDDQQNYTRFLLISKSRKIGRGANKTSLAFSLKNVPGALFKALSVFALRDISLSKIESRPMRGHPWEYVFFVDLLRGDDEPARNALRHLAEIAEFVKVLGVYPEARKLRTH
ncbi:MAG TPA: prephenate dehydratase [Verrucomicrobiae bacterium]|jgi:prephenate dehydratase|nr:prephenate dehydratase [Verrucomicrobiae bacterium]